MFDGILIIDKPAGLTSHDVVARLRRILRTKSIGHTGTLDPFATGILVMLVGKATRLARFLDKDEKEYEALVRFGFETDTGDRTGSVKDEGSRLKVQSLEDLSIKTIEDVLVEFRGEISQIPPMYSAKKHKGKKLYELARQGIEVEREPVKVTISKLKILDDDLKDSSAESGFETRDLKIAVSCSAGTYIRTLAEDIAKAANQTAHLAQLRRVRAGKFVIGSAVTLEDLEKRVESDELEDLFISMNDAVSNLKEFKLTASDLQKIRNGMKLSVIDRQFDPNEAIRLVTADEQLAAIGFYDEGEKSVRPKVVLM